MWKATVRKSRSHHAATAVKIMASKFLMVIRNTVRSQFWGVSVCRGGSSPKILGALPPSMPHHLHRLFDVKVEIGNIGIFNSLKFFPASF